MRLEKGIESAGYFWRPGRESDKVPGTLHISEAGEVTLDLIGQFGDVLSAFDDSDEIGRMVGVLQQGGYVTLDECWYVSRNVALMAGITRSSVRARFALIGAAYDANEDIVFSKVQFSVEGLDEWLDLSGIKTTVDWKTFSAVISYEPPERISYSLPDGLSVSFEFSHTIPGASARGASISQKAYITIEPVEPKAFSFFSNLIFRLTRFFCFALDKTLSQDSVTGFSNHVSTVNSDGGARYVPLALFYESLPSSDVPARISSIDWLFGFGHMRGDFRTIIARWLENYETSAPAFNLFFSAKEGGHAYLEGRFLSLAQGVETLHRRNSSETRLPGEQYEALRSVLEAACPSEHREWLKLKLDYGNEVSLRKRLSQMLSTFERFFGDGKQRIRIINSVVDTRNYLTHYDPRLESVAAKGADLWQLCVELERLFQFHFMRLLGFSEAQIDRVAESNRGLRRKS